MDRIIALDTETTGLSPNYGHRIIEIACVEVTSSDCKLQSIYHQYINPQRDIPLSATKIHGIRSEHLSDKPVFAEIASDFIKFISDSIIVIHNADFDLRFINYELGKLNLDAICSSKVIDTLELARKKFPGKKVSLDALCKRFSISLAERDVHGALIDAKLLAKVYLALKSEKQTNINFDSGNEQQALASSNFIAPRQWDMPSTEEIKLHKEFIDAYIKKVT